MIKGPTKYPEANEFLAKLEAIKEDLISNIQVAESGICSCGKQMDATNGMWWCKDCKVWKAKDPREMLANVYQPYIPLYVSEVHIDPDPALTKRTEVLCGALKDGKAGLTEKNCIIVIEKIADADEIMCHLKWLAQKMGFEVEKEGQHRAVINGVNYIVMSGKKWERKESRSGWRPSVYYL